MSYAENTSVPVERSRAEIERLLRKEGATQFVCGWDEAKGMSRIQCNLDSRILQFNVASPDVRDFTRTQKGRQRRGVAALKVVAQEERRRWRALLLIIKAKLELISGGQSTVEHEFLADILLPSKETVGEWMGKQLSEVYASGGKPKLLTV